MAGRRIDVFFYGLFMDVELLRSKGASPQNIRRAGALGYELRIGKRATLWREPKACAYGLLMELTHEEVEKLYPRTRYVHTDRKPSWWSSMTALGLPL